jgi:NitT/TauT family transport system permease protein
MRSSRHISHVGRHPGFSYPTSLSQRIYSILLAPLALVLVIVIVVGFYPLANPHAISIPYLLSALSFSFFRLLIAFVLALVLALPIAILIVENPTVERFLLPVFDVLQSIPILAFFPILIAVFVKWGFLNGAAIAILFLNMLWNIVFSLVGGLRVIPEDIKSAAHVFKFRGFSYMTEILLPAVVPYLVTGSLLAFAEGWNMLIVAEALHNYLPATSGNLDLFGIGSVLVNAAAGGNKDMFIAAIIVLVVAIAGINFFIWQRLLHYAERFKFE